jgi:hypothetical protein
MRLVQLIGGPYRNLIESDEEGDVPHLRRVWDNGIMIFAYVFTHVKRVADKDVYVYAYGGREDNSFTREKEEEVKT